jgi:hypothetical protein
MLLNANYRLVEEPGECNEAASSFSVKNNSTSIFDKAVDELSFRDDGAAVFSLVTLTSEPKDFKTEDTLAVCNPRSPLRLEPATKTLPSRLRSASSAVLADYDTMIIEPH